MSYIRLQPIEGEYDTPLGCKTLTYSCLVPQPKGHEFFVSRE